MMSSARRQTLEARLHHPDGVVGRHHMQHIRIEEQNHLAHRKSIMCEKSIRDFERLYFFLSGISSDSTSSSQGCRVTPLLPLRDFE